MGFSLIASAVVIGVSIAMAVEIFTADVFPTVDTINTAYEDFKDRIDTQAHASIDITTVTRQKQGQNYDYTITINNTGDITFPTSSMTVLFDGTTQTYTTTTTYLYPRTSTTLTVADIPGTGGKRIKIIAKNAIADYYTFTP